MPYNSADPVHHVAQNTEMDSHEEKLHKMIIQSKVNDTKDIMKRKAMEIDKSKVRSQRCAAGTCILRSFSCAGPSCYMMTRYGRTICDTCTTRSACAPTDRAARGAGRWRWLCPCAWHGRHDVLRSAGCVVLQCCWRLLDLARVHTPAAISFLVAPLCVNISQSGAVCSGQQCLTAAFVMSWADVLLGSQSRT